MPGERLCWCEGAHQRRDHGVDTMALAWSATVRAHDPRRSAAAGTHLLGEMRRRYPRIPALVLSMPDESLFAERVLRAGARGYVAKHEMGETVLTAIGRVLAGERYLSPKLTARFAEGYIDGGASMPGSSLAALSDRELQVFRLIGAGRADCAHSPLTT